MGVLLAVTVGITVDVGAGVVITEHAAAIIVHAIRMNRIGLRMDLALGCLAESITGRVMLVKL
jgi:hypothetical protein